jgi:hypothetical protein
MRFPEHSTGNAGKEITVVFSFPIEPVEASDPTVERWEFQDLIMGLEEVGIGASENDRRDIVTLHALAEYLRHRRLTRGRRAPVQADVRRDAGDRSKALKPGTISWGEHEVAWRAYAERHGRDQSAERMAERGGFSYGELIMFLGHEPATWQPRHETRF